MLQKLKLTAMAAAVALGLGTGVAQADTVSSQLFPGSLNQISDNSGESQNVDLNGNGLLDVGDTLRGIISFNTVEDLINGGVHSLGIGSPNNEFTGVFETEITSKTAAGGVGPLGLCVAPVGQFCFTFGPYAPFAVTDAGGVAGDGCAA
jgi:hypothetical protein